ncbi:MAG: hypothetical protein DBX52_06320 [Clostridiales bacterium]|nr:MAG: hypothetical protein DBX52_06320 [Clostridiales bacterium]
MLNLKKRHFLLEPLLMLLISITLIKGFDAQPVRGTVSYIAALSAPCMNTFTNGEQAASDTADTGDSENPAWYITGLAAGIAGLFATWRRGRKQHHHKQKRR